MSRKVVIGCLLSSFLMISANASADNHTVSLGYAQSKIQHFKDIRGLNAQYRYEWDSPVSVISSVTYMTLKEQNNLSQADSVPKLYEKIDFKYYSLLVGPAYRINDYVSLYALAGLAHTENNYQETDLLRHSEKNKANTTSVAYGVGVVINPFENISVNIGYEGTRLKHDEPVAVNGFNIGAGFRF